MVTKRQLLGALFIFAAGAGAGCAARVKNVTNLPPGVTLKEAQDWDAAVADLHKVADTVSKARQAITDLHSAGGSQLLSDEYYADALRAIAHIDQLELSAESVLRQAPQHFTESTKGQVKSYVAQISTELQKLNSSGATGIKNADSQQKINGLLGEVSSVVGLILSLTL